MERLPSLSASRPPTKTAPTEGNPGKTAALDDKDGRELVDMVAAGMADEKPMKPNEKAPVTSHDITGAKSGRRDLNPRPLAPQAWVATTATAGKPRFPRCVGILPQARFERNGREFALPAASCCNP